MADVLNSAKEIVDDIGGIANDVYHVSRAMAKTSVTRLTKDQIFQFPIFMDADIDDDEKFPIIKSIEKNYAQLVMAAITNNGVIDRNAYPEVNQFLRKFHNNYGLPVAVENYVDEGIRIESAIASEGYLSKDDLLDMWKATEDYLDMESLNSLYRPFQKTTAKLQHALEASGEVRMSRALEADTTKYFRRPEYLKDKNGNILTTNNKPLNKGGIPILKTDKSGNPVFQYVEAPAVGSTDYADYINLYGEPQLLKDWHDADIQSKIQDNLKMDEVKSELAAVSRIGGSVLKDDKFNSLTPTVISMTLANIKKGIGSWSQNLTIGIRAMPRMIPQSIMVDNMIEACKNRMIFKFIKWTNNEIKFSDLLFGVTSARNSVKTENKWLHILRKRAIRNKLPGYKLNPNTTIVITDNDAHYITERCGVNLNDATNVAKLMDKYFLLGFGIYDTEGKMLRIMYDGEREFSMYSLRSMMAEAKKDTNMLAMNRY